MRIYYLIILATAVFCFEGCKVEKAGAVNSEVEDPKKVSKLDDKKNKFGGEGGKGGLGPEDGKTLPIKQRKRNL